jgi:hypothetical protein
MDMGDALRAVAAMIAIVLAFGALVAFSAVVWFGIAEGMRRRKPPPWGSPWHIDKNAEKLHKIMHPDEDDESRKP